MKVVPYAPKYKQDFIDLNVAWISDMFKIEPADVAELENVDSAIEAGGQIFFTLDDDGTVLACCMIAPRADGEWEIMKFATRADAQGKGAGRACLQASIDYAEEQGVPSILIVSNRRCESAVHLYRKFGFDEIPVDKERFPFECADIAFEMSLAR